MVNEAVYTDSSGTVPLLGRDTAPSESELDESPRPPARLFRRDIGAAIEEPLVTPPREARATDASRLTFPVQMLIGCIVMTASIIGSVYGMTNGIRESQMKTESDLRDMRTRMEMQTEVDRARNEARAMEIKVQNEAIADLRRLTQMLQIQYSEIKKGS